MRKWVVGGIIALALGIVFLVTTTKSAQAQNIAPGFSHGPTIPLYVVSFDSTGKSVASMLAAGAGYSMIPTFDGTINRFTIGVPFFVSLPEQGDFAFRTGLTLGTFNNLISFGAAIDLVNTGNDTGALVGSFHKQNVVLLFNVGFNIGGGTPSPTGLMKADGTPRPASPPPAYISFGGN
jgi:hypothetical protein